MSASRVPAGRGLAWGEHRCGAVPREPGREEATRAHELVFVRSGAFLRSVGGEERWADATRVLLFVRDEPYRVAHPVGGGDRCALLALEGTLLEEALDAAGGALGDPRRAPARDALAPAALALRRVALERALGEAEPLEREEQALALLRATVRVLLQARARGHDEPARPSRAHVVLARSACAHLARDFRRRSSLAEIARALGCSPFHLSRVFTRVTGLPLHRYRNRLRLRLALERVAGGERDLARLALACGFASHSHLDDAFRREYGSAPGRLRPRSGAASKILEAPPRPVPEARLHADRTR